MSGLLVICLSLAPTATLGDSIDEARIGAIVWDSAPVVLAARAQIIEADAVRKRSHLLPNPVFGAGWATVPVGTRPAETSFWEVPNYSVGIGGLIEIGKRGPRQRAAEASLHGARFVALDAYRRSFFAVLETLSNQAAATLRAAVLGRLVASSEESLRLQSARADRGDVAALEVDRSRVEHLRLRSVLRGAEAEREEAVLACTRILATDCPRFSTEDEALSFLRRIPSSLAEAVGGIEARPDLQALRAEKARLQAESVLARRLKVPDLTLALAYTRDQFVSAGNQLNSLSVSLSLPLPFFDRGQVEAYRVDSLLAHNARLIDVLSTGGRRELAIGRQQLFLLQERARDLEEQALPQAREVLEHTEAAARRGGAALPDILLVRRALEELALDRVEVLAAIHRATLELRRTAADLPQPRTQGW